MNRRFIPNAFTCCNLICGCVATGAGFHSHFRTAFLFIVLGALFDFVDGFAARWLRVPSRMGIELDSLADCVTFGVAPSSMLFCLFTLVRYPEAMYSEAWWTWLPYSAFLLAAFSAYRLAKFNLDERQHTEFIGLPTPACALFWGALLAGSEHYLRGPMFNAPFLLAFMLLFCFLLVSDVPMFSLKFKHWSMHDRSNTLKWGFLGACVVILAVCGLCASSGTHLWQYLCRGVAGCIGLYVVVNIVRVYVHSCRQA